MYVWLKLWLLLRGRRQSLLWCFLLQTQNSFYICPSLIKIIRPLINSSFNWPTFRFIHLKCCSPTNTRTSKPFCTLVLLGDWVMLRWARIQSFLPEFLNLPSKQPCHRYFALDGRRKKSRRAPIEELWDFLHRHRQQEAKLWVIINAGKAAFVSYSVGSQVAS